MAKAIDIARYMLWLSQNEPEPAFVTHFQIQKLLYYAQGWSLAMREEKIFDDRIEGWTNGPVVPSVFPVLANYKSDPIPPSEARNGSGLDSDAIRLVEWIWDSYGKFSAGELWRKTHSEPPFIESRIGLEPRQRGKKQLGIGTMSDFFKSEYDRNALPGLTIKEIAEADKDFAEGRGVTGSQLQKRLAKNVQRLHAVSGRRKKVRKISAGSSK
jgi:uncharacterized phage-associated protein